MMSQLAIRPTRILAGATASAALPDLKTTVIVVIFFTITAAVIGGTAWGSLTEPTIDDGTPHRPSTIHRDGWTLAAYLPAPIRCATIVCGLFQQWNVIAPTAALALIVLTYKGDHVPGAVWSRWVVRRILLTRHGLPMEIELEKSLEDARTQGILRTAGTRYRFQHVKIQKHLAQATRPTDQRPPHPTPPPSPHLRRHPHDKQHPKQAKRRLHTLRPIHHTSAVIDK
ncbi:hypothetical protein AOZ06_04255 [Kibdelosporangium phytohabitans]|uniref:Uncharacterized protein n=1 Tax=Kibdelosporangium phytohabitans TaxID=860235 RepID=A0A0N9HJK3_9PSEU|nr:hypothetical protein AOZ06_04255 [Kibdelosporangium phytohabitans]